MDRTDQRLREAEKLEAIRRFAGGVAHDFNNILAGVFAYGEMLHDETQDGSSLQRYAQAVLAAATRGRSLVEQILAYSSSQRATRAPVDIGPVLSRSLETVHASLPAAIRLEAHCAASALVVIGDANQLQQVVMILCGNAVHAMREGGTLRVELESEDLADARGLSHGALLPGRHVRLGVQDDGCGMSQATLARLFEPFFTTREAGHGTGLGLALVYAIATDMGGAIDVASAVGQGSRFTVYLPQA